MARHVRIVRNLGETVEDAVQASSPDPSQVAAQSAAAAAAAATNSAAIAQNTFQQIAQAAQVTNIPVAQVAQQVAQTAAAVAQQAQAQTNQMVASTSQQPLVYNSQDPNSPSEKSVSMVDYLVENKWWVIIAVAVAYYALH